MMRIFDIMADKKRPPWHIYHGVANGSRHQIYPSTTLPGRRLTTKEAKMTLYCGWDLHKKFSYCIVMSKDGELLMDRRIEHKPAACLENVFRDLPEKPMVAIEATSNWYWMYELLEAQGAKVKLVHAKKAKAIASAKIKTDRLSAEVLAHLMRSDLLPESYIPPRKIRDLREELRYRAALVAMRANVKNMVRHLLGRRGIDIPSKSLWNPSSRTAVKCLDLAAPFQDNLEGYLQIIDNLSHEIARAEKRLLREENSKQEEVSLLTTAPGIGKLSALFIVAEIGDICRFPSAKHLCAYAGLVPSLHASGQTCYTGHITKQGSKWLRWILVEDAAIAIRSAGPIQDMYLRLNQKKGHSVAVVACARKLLKYVYHMLTHKITWEENLRRYYGQARVSRMV